MEVACLHLDSICKDVLTVSKCDDVTLNRQ